MSAFVIGFRTRLQAILIDSAAVRGYTDDTAPSIGFAFGRNVPLAGPALAGLRRARNPVPMRKLRFGIMCDGLVLPAWQAACLLAVVSTGLAELALVVLEGPDVRRDRIRRKLRQPRSILFNGYNLFWVRRRAAAYRRQDVASLLASVPTITCEVARLGRHAQSFHPDDIRKIAAQDLDFILRFGFNILGGDILNTPRYGIWSYHHGDEERYRGSPPGFWEVANSDATTGAMLQRLTHRLDSGVILHKGRFRTRSSYLANINAVLLGSTTWCAQAVVRIALGDTSAVLGAPSQTRAPIRLTPSNVRFLWFVLQQLVRQPLALFQRTLFADTWTVGIAAGDAGEIIRHGRLRDVQWLAARPRGQYLADPHPLVENGNLRVLVEDFEYGKKGHIASFEWRDAGSLPRLEPFLEESVHLAYPTVIRDNGSLYLSVDVNESGSVRLYERDVRGAWRPAHTVLQGICAVDPTFYRHGELWWMFCTDARNMDDTHLYLFYAPQLAGPWKPHPFNPVKSDVSSARPAGPLFELDGRLCRPAQDCSRTYGGAVAINRIDLLTPTSFAETVIARIEPDAQSQWGYGLHTFCAVGSDRVVVDGKRRNFAPFLAPKRAKARAARSARYQRLDKIASASERGS